MKRALRATFSGSISQKLLSAAQAALNFKRNPL
jgi:hypothetical protein